MQKSINDKVIELDIDHLYKWSDFLHAREYGYFHFGVNLQKSVIGSCIALKIGLASHQVMGCTTSMQSSHKV